MALIDLDLHFGTVALGLDLEPSHGLREILESPERVDALFVKSSMSQATDNLSVLAAEEALDSPTMIRASAFEKLAMSLSDEVEYLIVDAPGEVLMAEPALLMQADSLVVVSEMNLAAIRDILRLTSFVRDAGFEKNLTIVGNKSIAKGPIEVEQKEFARGINHTARYQDRLRSRQGGPADQRSCAEKPAGRRHRQRHDQADRGGGRPGEKDQFLETVEPPSVSPWRSSLANKIRR